MNYKLIITNHKIYKEVELPDTINKVNIGTSKGCEVRLQREDFFEDFTVTLLKINDQWVWNSTDNIYICVDIVRYDFGSRNSGTFIHPHIQRTVGTE